MTSVLQIVELTYTISERSTTIVDYIQDRLIGRLERRIVLYGWLDVAIENRKEKKRAKGNERSVVNVSTRQSNDFRLLRKKAVEVG